MEVTKTVLPGAKVKLAVRLTIEEWNRILDAATQKIAGEIKVDGFRPGHAPRDIVIAKAGEARVISEATERAIEEFYPKAAREQDVRPVNFPSIAVDKVGLDEALEFTAEVAILPEVKLGDYMAIKISKPEVTISETEVEDVLKNMQKKSAEFNPVERPAAQGDWVEVDFSGTMDGKEFAGGASKNHPMVIGDKLFIPGFEEGIVGMNVNEEKDVEVTFPEDYHAKELAGKKALFHIKLNQVKAINYPVIDDEFAKKVAQMETLAVLKEDIKKYLELDAIQKNTEKMREDAILALAKVSEVELSDDIIDQEVDAMVHDLKHQVSHMNMTWEDYLAKSNVTEEVVKDGFKVQAADRVKAGLALEAFRKAEKVEVTDEDIETEIEALQARYPEDTDKIVEEYTKATNREKLRNMLASRKAIDRLVEIGTK